VLLLLAPTAWAASQEDEGDSIDADDQSLVNGTVTVTEVNATKDGWIAVHLDEGGKPGKVIGHTQIKKGELYGVGVKLEENVPVGGKVWPMLHIDAGTIGTYEFPGPDAPVIVNGNIVMKQIALLATKAGAESADNGLTVADQALSNGSITAPKVVAERDGWLTVHVDENGNPGKVIGFTAVKKGTNNNVVVKLDEDVAVGGKVWPMLHVDEGTIGKYEFPGPDTPVIVNGGVVMKQITISNTSGGQQPSGLPKTGQAGGDAAPLLLAALSILGLGLWLRRRSARRAV
jgi:LPXTG-motif cell wall-anchored protein